MEKLVRASANYTIFGLVSGFYWRELSKHYKFTGADGVKSQLSVAHTHCFSLGTLFFLLVLVLEKNFRLTQQPHYKRFYISYNIGLGLTLLCLLGHGTLTVIGKEHLWTSPFAGLAGLGHITMSVGFYYFFKVLKSAVQKLEKQ